MVLTRIREEKRTARSRSKTLANGTVGLPNMTKATTYDTPTLRNSTRSTSLTTSAIANETFSSTSSSTDDTLSMISTPWSTETWKSVTGTEHSSSYVSWTNSGGSSFTSFTIEPRTTTTYGMPSPEVKTGSNLTVTLLGDVITTPSVSRYALPLLRQNNGSSPTFSSWTLETYTSTGLVSSLDRNALKVNYPWSPSTFMSDTEITDYYPSSLTLISQKGSRETFGYGKYEVKKPMTPMNYVVLTKDDHPNLDWMLVKQKGIPIRKE